MARDAGPHPEQRDATATHNRPGEDGHAGPDKVRRGDGRRQRIYGQIIHTPGLPTAAAQTLTVAIAIVRDESRVLLVQRRGDADEQDSWQFPAGMIKPGLNAPTVAVRETLGETGVHCAPTRTIGSRIHPRTNVLCEYVLCEYLSGDAENRDPGENVSVTWAPTSRLARFIPAERIFAPVLSVLEVPI